MSMGGTTRVGEAARTGGALTTAIRAEELAGLRGATIGRVAGLAVIGAVWGSRLARPAAGRCGARAREPLALFRTEDPRSSRAARPAAGRRADAIRHGPLRRHRRLHRLIEREEPPRVIALLREFHARMEAIFEHEGTLDKFLGDAVMATFGAPEAGPHDAAKSFACARAMLDANRPVEPRARVFERPARPGSRSAFVSGPLCRGTSGRSAASSSRCWATS